MTQPRQGGRYGREINPSTNHSTGSENQGTMGGGDADTGIPAKFVKARKDKQRISGIGTSVGGVDVVIAKELRTAPAKLQGNRVHARLKVLCFEWMRANKPGIVERLRDRAKRQTQ